MTRREGFSAALAAVRREFALIAPGTRVDALTPANALLLRSADRGEASMVDTFLRLGAESRILRSTGGHVCRVSVRHEPPAPGIPSPDHKSHERGSQ